MIFEGFSTATLILGGIALAALLAALQRLRAHRQIVRVATTLFWQTAAQPAPARTLSRRFRHLLAFLLVLAIVWLLWFAAARPAFTPAPGTRTEVFYLDASAGMTAGARFAEARRALIADAGSVPAARRAVYLGDAYGTRLLAPGEDIALLPYRLANHSPDAIPTRFADWLSARRRAGGESGPVAIHYYGTATALKAAQDATIIQGYVAPPIRGNRGIVAVGAVPAASGAWDKADLLVRVAAAPGTELPATLRLTRNGKPFEPAVERGSDGRFVLRDLPADGASIEARLPQGDAFPVDDRATFRLPQRRAIRVAVAADIPAPVRAAIAADPAIEQLPPARAATDADVVVRSADAAIAPGKPALILAPVSADTAAFRFSDPVATSQDALADTLDQLGLGQFDAAAAADALGRPVSVELAAGPVRSVTAWRDLFDPSGSIARSSTMPLFVAQSLRWLAASPPWIAEAAAGGSLSDLSSGEALAESPALARRAMGGTVALTSSGPHRIGGTPIAVTLADPATTLGADAILPAATAPSSAPMLPLDLPFTLALLGVLLLGAVEWVLYQRGRVP